MADTADLQFSFEANDLLCRQAFVMADFLRPAPHTHMAKAGVQNTIASRLHDWTAAGLQRILKRPTALGLWLEDEDAGLPARRIYELENVDPSASGWSKLYHRRPCAAVLELLRPVLEDKLIVGFELSPYQKHLCDALNIPYISFAIHPFRFMKDYAFMIESNFVSEEHLSSFQLNPDDIAFAAQMKTAQLASLLRPRLECDSAVLFGQVDGDAALLHRDGGFIALQDYPNEIRSLLSSFRTVYFKPHPYQDRIAAQVQVRFLQQFANVAFVNWNAYMLLAAPEIIQVSALSSSILSEAAVFQKPAVALSPTWKDKSREPAFSLAILSPQFWRHVFAHESSKLGAPVQFLGEASLKSLLNISWETFGSSEVQTNRKMIELNKTLVCGAGAEADAISFSSSWTAPAPDHRWMSGETGSLSFKVFAGVEASYSVELWLAAMASPEAPVQCTISTCSIVLAAPVFTRRDCQPISFTLSPEMCSSIGEVVLEIRCSAANSPKIIAGIEDTRSLSIALHAVKVRPSEDGEVIAIGQQICVADLPENSALFTRGWHPAEPGGVWSDGRKSQIAIKLAEIPDEDLEIVLVNVDAFLTDLLPTNTLFAYVNGAKSAVYSFHKSDAGRSDVTIALPKHLLADGQSLVLIDLELLGSHSPAMAGHSPDARELGLRFECLRVDSKIGAIARHPRTHIANIIGPFNIHTGLASMARSVYGAIEIALDGTRLSSDRLPTTGPRAVNFNNSLHMDEDTGFVALGAGGSDVNIFIGDVTRIEKMVSRYGIDFLANHYNIVCGAWDLERMPTYLANTRYFDEFWGLSSFIASSARARMDVSVQALPIPVEIYYPPVVTPRDRQGIPEDCFAFLFTFSIESTMARTNPEAVLQAFAVAFPDETERVALVINCVCRQESAADSVSYAAFKALARRDRRIVLIEDILNRDEKASLYLNCDAYVSLHRAEGFGLTMAEAMGYGKPTIATGYSGNLDFMNESNSCLVAYSRTDLRPGDYYDQGGQWAEPDVNDAARHMRRVFEDVTFRETIALAGQNTIRDDYSPVVVGRKLLKRILEIYEEMP
ncbi:glycosyltransferase [Ensifer adhaerens]|uniref:glycosyltransferase n=1 Tax=Ensifer adhaerens TaxID=106592 RepID=UPI00069EBD14|nr:glycosyltransferase [Ensifer adhaerens]